MTANTKTKWKKVESKHLHTFVDEMDFYYRKWINNLLSRKHFTAESKEAIFAKINLLMEE